MVKKRHIIRVQLVGNEKNNKIEHYQVELEVLFNSYLVDLRLKNNIWL